MCYAASKADSAGKDGSLADQNGDGGGDSQRTGIKLAAQPFTEAAVGPIDVALFTGADAEGTAFLVARIALPDPKSPGRTLGWELASPRASIPGLDEAEAEGHEFLQDLLGQYIRWVLVTGASEGDDPHLPPMETRLAIRTILDGFRGPQN